MLKLFHIDTDHYDTDALVWALDHNDARAKYLEAYPDSDLLFNVEELPMEGVISL